MLTKAENVKTVNENIGLVDRVVRFAVGVTLLGVGLVYLVRTPELFTTSLRETLALVAIMISVYPIMTAVLGMDPLYQRLHVRSCGDSGINVCGTFPYQMRAAFGKAPRYCEVDDERSLEACHTEPREAPHHAVWRVDMDPILYPDEADWKAFAKREREKKARTA